MQQRYAEHSAGRCEQFQPRQRQFATHLPTHNNKTQLKYKPESGKTAAARTATLRVVMKAWPDFEVSLGPISAGRQDPAMCKASLHDISMSRPPILHSPA
jgi:hypothetical protein